VIGTVNWLAPEQLRSDRASPLSDVFAWGGLVAYAATGRPPFGTGPAEVIVHRILHQDADLGGTEGEVRAMVELAMAKDPEERPTARALLARLLGAGTRKADAAAVASRVVKDTWTGGNAWQQQAAMAPASPGSAPAEQPANGAATPAMPAPTAAGPGAAAPTTDRPGVATPKSSADRPGTATPTTDRPGATPREPATPPPAGPPSPAAGDLAAAAGVALDGAGNPVRPAAAKPAGTAEPAPPVPRQPSGGGPAAGGDAGKGRALVDRLPGGVARDLLLVFGFAMVLAATLPAVRPADGAPVPAALLVLVVGAALLGPLRGVAGFALAVLATEATVHDDALAFLNRPRAIAWYAALAVVVLLVGRLAGRGRQLRPLRLAIALAVGYGLVYLGLVIAEWVANGGPLGEGL